MSIQEIIDRSYTEICKELCKYDFNDFLYRTITVSIDPIQLDRINLYALVNVTDFYKFYDVTIVLDAWDVDGHQMIMPLKRIEKELTKKITLKYENDEKNTIDCPVSN